MQFMLWPLSCLGPRCRTLSGPTTVLATPLIDPSKHTNLLYFVPLPKKLLAFMKSSEGKETLKNNLTSLEKSSPFMANWR